MDEKKKALIQRIEAVENEANRLSLLTNSPEIIHSLDVALNALRSIKRGVRNDFFPRPSQMADGERKPSLGLARGLSEFFGHYKEERTLLDLGYEVERFYKEEY